MAKAENGALPIDVHNNAIQVGNQFQTADNTGSPQVSPLAYTGTVVNLVVPTAAIQLVCFPSTDMRISELAAMSQYDIIPAGTKEVVPCAGMTSIYIKQDSAGGNLRFKFITL